MSIVSVLLAFGVASIIMIYKLSHDGYNIAARMVISVMVVYGENTMNNLIDTLITDYRLKKDVLAKYIIKHMKSKKIDDKYIKRGIEEYESIINH